MKKIDFKNSYFIYTCTFLILLPILFLPFFLEGKTFVWYLDGLDQHYPLLKYYGKLLRGLLSGQGFQMVDFKLGLGFDTITTLQYYVLGDPIALFSIFMNGKNAVFLYNFLICLRFYLSGISFLVFAKYWKRDGYGAALGALIYVFCGYSLFSGIRHPFFMNPMIYLPLLIIGIEEVLRRKKPYLMIFMVFLCAVSNFYFFFDLSVIAVIYIVFRYVTVYRKKDKNVITGFFITGFRTGGYYCLGVLLAAFLLLPVIYAFLQNGRLNTGPEQLTGLFRYNRGYYLSLLQGMIAPGVYSGFWIQLSFSAVLIVSFAILLSGRKYRQLILVYLLVLLGMCVPAFGYFMNGCSYVANRWCFLLSLLIAISFTVTYERFFCLEKKEKMILLSELGGYGMLMILFPSPLSVKLVFVQIIIIAIVVLILPMKRICVSPKVKGIAVYAIVFISLVFNGNYLYSPQFKNYSRQFLSTEQIDDSLKKGALACIPAIKDDSFYRIETYGDSALNESLTVGYRDVSGYFSLMDNSVAVYLKELESRSQLSSYRFENLDNRTILDTLASVKYVCSTRKKAAPYGYIQVRKTASGNYLFKNLYALPIGYTYSHYIEKADYDKLDALQKQNSMLRGVVLDKASGYGSELKTGSDASIEKPEVELIPDENIRMDGKTIEVMEEGAAITLLFHSRPNSETYVRFGNFAVDRKAAVSPEILVKGAHGVSKRFHVRSAYYNSYFGKENFLVNTGYSKRGETRVVIRFLDKEKYRYDSIDVFSASMSHYKAQVKALKQKSLQHIKEGRNSLEGDITLAQKGIMVFSIPYSKGWSAYVDGAKTRIQRGNVMYMALPLETGSHHIVLKYRTPYFDLGCLISLVTLIISIVVVLWNKRKNKRIIIERSEEDGTIIGSSTLLQ